MKPLRLLFVLLACFAVPAHAQSWPSKPVRIVVAYPPGGGIDVMARQIAERLGSAWGQPVVVENKPGGHTIIAADAVAKSAPDGHTILFHIGVVAAHPTTQKNAGYDVVASSPDEFAAYVRKDSENRAQAVRISGAKVE